MPTRRLADQRIRAASQGTLRLDVRGPVSEALAKTRVSVPPAQPEPLAETAASTPTPEQAASAAEPRPSLRGIRPARRVLKPFKKTAWPTQRARSVEPEAMAGLTDDERRVHRALIDALHKRAQTGLDSTGTPGLSYAERKRLQALDLAFINAELAKMEKPLVLGSPRFRVSAALIALLALGVMAAALVKGDVVGGANLLTNLLTTLALALSALGGMSDLFGLSVGRPERKRIYEALRELALVVDDPSEAASAALQRSDRLIDQLTTDAAPVLLGDRLGDDSPANTASGSPTRRRVRS